MGIIHRPIIGADGFLSDFRSYVAPFQNEGDSKATGDIDEAKFRTFHPFPVKLRELYGRNVPISFYRAACNADAV